MGSSVQPLNDNNGAIAVMPSTGAPVKSATEIASDEARARIAAGGSALPPGPGQPRVAPGNPAGGQFAPSTVKPIVEPGAAAAPAGGPAAPAAPVAPGAAAPLPPENETPEAKQAREAAEAAAAAGEETPEQIAAREAEEALTIALPFEAEGDEDAPTITADTPETAAMLAQLVEEATQGRESAIVLEHAQQQVTQINELREYASVDPIGFTVDMLGKDVEKAEHLALFLLTQPTMFERVKTKLQKLVTDPNEIRVMGSELRAKRAEMKDQATEQIQTSRAINENLRDVQATVASLFPSELTEAQRRVAFRDCLRDLQEYADQQGLVTLPIQNIPALLADRLSALGIDPEAAASRAAVAVARRGKTPTARAAIPAVPRRPAAPAAPPTGKRDGKTFVAGAVKRKAAAMPGAGAGAPSSAAALFSVKKPDGSTMSTAEAVAAHRERLAKGIRSY